MRVITVTERFPDPTETFVTSKVLALRQRSIESVVVTHQVLEGASREVEIRLKPKVGDRNELRSAAAAAARRDPRGTRFALTISEQADRARALPLVDPRADVIHFEGAGLAVKYLDLLPHFGAAKVITCRGSDVRVDPIGSTPKSDGLTQVFAQVDRIHCTSAELANRCLAIGARADQLFVAPRGADVRLFTPPPTRLRPDALTLRIVSVGRLHWVKGYEYAVQAVRLLRDAGHRVTYTVAAIEEGHGEAVRLVTRDLDLEDVVTFVGHRSPKEVRDLLAQSDVFLHPSVSEGLSLATTEAMAMALPVVVTDVGGMRELVRDGVDGFVVPARDPAALAAAVVQLRSPSVREQMGHRGAERVRRNFDAAVQMDRLVELYGELVTQTTSSNEAPRDSDLVSVVIVARNAGATIEDQLRALSFQVFEGEWEVIVVDNGSTDDTRVRVLSWSDRVPHLRVVDASGKGNIAYARNLGVDVARGSRILMCDADDVVAPGWLSGLAGELRRYPLVIGALERSLLKPPGHHIALEVDAVPEIAGNHQVKVRTCNVGFRREVFERVGGFDDSFQRGADIDFGWRAIDLGVNPRFVSDAVVHHRPRAGLSGVARQGFGDGRVGVALYARYRDTGMPRASRRAVLARYRELAQPFGSRLRSRDGRVQWIYTSAQSVGRIVGSLLGRVRYL